VAPYKAGVAPAYQLTPVYPHKLTILAAGEAALAKLLVLTSAVALPAVSAEAVV